MKKWLMILGMGLLCLSLFKKQPSLVRAQMNSLTRAQSLPISSRGGLEETPQQAINNNSAKIEIEDVPPQEAHMEIAEIETDLATNNTIERLNEGIVDKYEREMIGKKLQRLDTLRIQDLEREIEEIQKNLSELEARHSARLRAFGVEKS